MDDQQPDNTRSRTERKPRKPITITGRSTASPNPAAQTSVVSQPAQSPPQLSAHEQFILGLRQSSRGGLLTHAQFGSTRSAWARHYTRFDGPNEVFVWRFSSRPLSELVCIQNGTPAADIVKVIGQHSGGANKDDQRVRTLSFCRNVGALLGTAASSGGDKKVLNIVDKAKYLCKISLTALAGHDISALSALSRTICAFETEYVLIPSPGKEIKLTDLGVIVYANPFKGKILVNRIPVPATEPVAVRGVQNAPKPQTPEITLECGGRLLCDTGAADYLACEYLADPVVAETYPGAQPMPDAEVDAIAAYAAACAMAADPGNAAVRDKDNGLNEQAMADYLALIEKSI